MSHPTPTRTPLPAIAVTVAVTALLAAGLAVQDVWLARSLETALAARQPSVRTASGPAPVAGSESFWLAPAPSETLHPVSFAPALPIGTRVALGTGTGQRQLEVVEVRALPADASAPAQHLLVVTLHDVADRAASPVRLVLDAEAAARLAAVPPVSDRAL